MTRDWGGALAWIVVVDYGFMSRGEVRVLLIRCQGILGSHAGMYMEVMYDIFLQPVRFGVHV